MGRLFWKFFLFIWLGQVAGVLGTGAIFWLEHQQFAARMARGEAPPPPPPHFQPSPPHASHPPPPPRPEALGPRLPVLPLLAALVASLFCTAGLAWYFAKPIRHLRQAFNATAEGRLDVRVSLQMEGRRDELADLGDDFDRMTARLQTLMAGQTRLLHDVSHEMRSPLARLQAAIGLARQQPGRMTDSLERIEREGERMNILVGELLTLSRLETGVTGEQENVNLNELLAGIVDDARFEGAARQVTIDYLAGPPAEIAANPELLHRAIENVVRNALRYSPAGGVVRIAAGCTATHWQLSIADQGPGVIACELEHIFKPFFRGSMATTGSGYGLGLAIAQRVITAVNGTITAKNADPQGLIVAIEWPR